MTPTEQDKELGVIRQKLYVYLSEAFPDRHFDEEQFEQWLDTRKEFVDTAMRLITADRKRVALEARIDELENRLRVQFIPSHWARLCAEVNSLAKYVDRRIAELKAQQEEV